MLALYELLFEREVGTHSRARERAQEREDAAKSAAYQASVARLKRKQGLE